MTKHIIEVYTQQDCNDLCAVLSRSGYCTIAYFIPSSETSSLMPKQWRIEYYDPKEAEGCPDVLCEDCSKDCEVRKLGLVPKKE